MDFWIVQTLNGLSFTERWPLVLGLIYGLVVLCATYGIVGALQGSLLSRLSRRAAP